MELSAVMGACLEAVRAVAAGDRHAVAPALDAFNAACTKAFGTLPLTRTSVEQLPLPPPQMQQALCAALSPCLRVVHEASSYGGTLALEAALAALRHVFHATSCVDTEMDHFRVVAMLSSLLVEQKGLAEEAKAGITGCIAVAMWRCPTGKCAANVPGTFYAGVTAQSLFHMLEMANSERSRAVVTHSLEAVSALLARPRGGSPDLDMLGHILPGVVTKLTKTATGDYKQGTAVTAKAVDILAAFLPTVLSNEANRSISSKSTPVTTVNTVDDLERLLRGEAATPQGPTDGTAGSESSSPFLVKRTAAWLEQTTTRLEAVLVGVLGYLMKDERWAVRLAGTRLAMALVERCGNVLSAVLVRKSLECTVASLADAADQERMPLSNLLRETLRSGLVSLSRVMHSGSDEERMAVLRTVRACIKVLSGHTDGTVLGGGEDLVASSLVQSVGVELGGRSGVVLMRDGGDPISAATSAQGDGDLWTENNIYRFTLSMNSEVVANHREVSRMLGACGIEGLALLEWLRARITRAKVMTPSLHQMLYIMNDVILGSAARVNGPYGIISPEMGTASPCNPSLHNALERQAAMWAREVVNSPLWSLPTTNADARSRTRTAEELRCNTLGQCLLVDSVAACAEVLGGSVEKILMMILYPLLEKLADPAEAVHLATRGALARVARAGGYGDSAALLQRNTDYVVGAVRHRMMYYEMNRSAPAVFTCLLKHISSDGIVPLIGDTLDSILSAVDGSATSGDEQRREFLVAMHGVATAIGTSLKETRLVKSMTEGDLEPTPSPAPEAKPVVSTAQFAWELDRVTRLYGDAGGDEKEETDPASAGDGSPCADDKFDDDDGDTGPVDSNDNGTPPLSTEHEQIVRILGRLQHLLSATDLMDRMVILETMDRALGCLLDCHERTVLPLIHTLWPPFSISLRDQRVPVAARATEVFITMARVAGPSFIRDRFIKDGFRPLKDGAARAVSVLANEEAPGTKPASDEGNSMTDAMARKQLKVCLEFWLDLCNDYADIFTPVVAEAVAFLLDVKRRLASSATEEDAALRARRELVERLIDSLAQTDPDVVWYLRQSDEVQVSAKESTAAQSRVVIPSPSRPGLTLPPYQRRHFMTKEAMRALSENRA